MKNWLNKYLRKFNVELHGLGYLQSLAKGEFKKDEFSFYNKVFSNEPILIYDLEANRGLTIKSFIENFPRAVIHSFEPYPPLSVFFKKEYKYNTNVFINEMGVSDKESELRLNINKSVDTNSFLPSKKTGLNSVKQVETQQLVKVPVTTIDDYAGRNRHERINILKLDIQESELKALKGAATQLQQRKIDIIFTETYFVQQYEEQPLFPAISSFLDSFGYVLQDIYHPVYGKGRIAWCDIIFIRDDLKFR